jgi:hypothetical protein
MELQITDFEWRKIEPDPLSEQEIHRWAFYYEKHNQLFIQTMCTHQKRRFACLITYSQELFEKQSQPEIEHNLRRITLAQLAKELSKNN